MSIEIECAGCGGLLCTASALDNGTRIRLELCRVCTLQSPQIATLRKPLLDWYHNWTDPSHPYEPMTLYKAIEEVYGVDVVKREVPKE